MKVRLGFVLAAVFGVIGAAFPAFAHHSFYIDVKDEDGKVNNWDFELASPNGLMRRGWTRNSLKIGDVVTVTGWAAKNAPYVGNTSAVTLSDGRKVFAGSSAENETNP